MPSKTVIAKRRKFARISAFLYRRPMLIEKFCYLLVEIVIQSVLAATAQLIENICVSVIGAVKGLGGNFLSLSLWYEHHAKNTKFFL